MVGSPLANYVNGSSSAMASYRSQSGSPKQILDLQYESHVNFFMCLLESSTTHKHYVVVEFDYNERIRSPTAGAAETRENGQGSLNHTRSHTDVAAKFNPETLAALFTRVLKPSFAEQTAAGKTAPSYNEYECGILKKGMKVLVFSTEGEEDKGIYAEATIRYAGPDATEADRIFSVLCSYEGDRDDSWYYEYRNLCRESDTGPGRGLERMDRYFRRKSRAPLIKPGQVQISQSGRVTTTFAMAPSDDPDHFRVTYFGSTSFSQNVDPGETESEMETLDDHDEGSVSGKPRKASVYDMITEARKRLADAATKDKEKLGTQGASNADQSGVVNAAAGMSQTPDDVVSTGPGSGSSCATGTHAGLKNQPAKVSQKFPNGDTDRLTRSSQSDDDHVVIDLQDFDKRTVVNAELKAVYHVPVELEDHNMSDEQWNRKRAGLKAMKTDAIARFKDFEIKGTIAKRPAIIFKKKTSRKSTDTGNKPPAEAEFTFLARNIPADAIASGEYVAIGTKKQVYIPLNESDAIKRDFALTDPEKVYRRVMWRTLLTTENKIKCLEVKNSKGLGFVHLIVDPGIWDEVWDFVRKVGAFRLGKIVTGIKDREKSVWDLANFPGRKDLARINRKEQTGFKQKLRVLQNMYTKTMTSQAQGSGGDHDEDVAIDTD